MTEHESGMADPDRHKLTSRNVGMNVARIRGGAGMTTRALSESMKAAGVAISSSGITDIERGRRVVSVDQLTALARCLDVSPAALLMPWTTDAQDDVALSGVLVDVASALWAWLTATGPMEPGADEYERETFRRRSSPPWSWGRWTSQ